MSYVFLGALIGNLLTFAAQHRAKRLEREKENEAKMSRQYQLKQLIMKLRKM